MQPQETALLVSEVPEVSSGRDRRTVGMVVASLAAAIGLVACVALLGSRGATEPPVAGASVGDLVQLEQISSYPQSQEVQQAIQAAQAPIDKTLQALSPKENLHDNNPCADDEELFEGLCYAKCAILSAGMKPVRCAAHICEPLDSNGQHKCQLSETAITSILSSPSLMPCHGYDIAGTREGRKRCPHSPGACLKDEELYLGCPGSDQWKFLDPKMEVLYHIFSHIFCRDIPLHSPSIGLRYGGYLQFRFLKWPLT